MQDAAGEDRFEIALTVDDQAAFLRYLARRPYRLTIQAAAFAFMWLCFASMQLAIGLLGALFFASHGLWEGTRTYLTSGFGRDLLASAPIFTAFVAALALFNIFVLIPRQCRRLAAKTVGPYPVPPGESPRTTLMIRLRLTEKGVETASEAERVFVAWPFIRRLVETRRHMFLMAGRESALVIAHAALDPESRARFRDTVQRHLAEVPRR